MLEVTIHTLETLSGGEDCPEPLTVEGIDYVSLVANSTYGPPALIAPARNKDEARAHPGDTVLYINTAFIPAFEIRRTED